METWRVPALLMLTACGAAAPRPSTTLTVEPTAAAPASSSEADVGVRRERPPEFAANWSGLHEALRTGRADELVDPALGLVVLDNPGAFVTVEHFDSFCQGFAGRPASATMGECALRSGPLPEFSCETERWSLEGCIVSEPSRPRLKFLYTAYVEYALEPGSEPDLGLLAACERLEALASVTVTDTARSTRWHFGSVEGRWRLLVVDVVTPCSA